MIKCRDKPPELEGPLTSTSTTLNTSILTPYDMGNTVYGSGGQVNYNCVKNNCNVPNCVYCEVTSTDKCVQCESGYNLSTDKKCIKQVCDDVNCVKCTDNNGETLCSECKAGYNLYTWGWGSIDGPQARCDKQ